MNSLSHKADLNAAKLSTARLSIFSNTFLVLAKLIIGWLMGSVAVISEAIHSGIDLLAAIIAFFSIRKADQPPDDTHPYGHGKWENVSGVIEALLIFGAAFYIIYEAGMRLLHGGKVENLGWGVLVMAGSALINWLVSSRLFKVARASESVALEADAWHLRTDVYTSLGVLGGLGLIYLTKWVIWDSLTAILVALLIIKAAWDLTTKSFSDIIDASLPSAELEIVKEVLKNHQEFYLEYHELRSRKSGSERFLDLHLVVPHNWDVGKAHEYCDHLETEIEQILSNTQVVIHVEPCSLNAVECTHCPKCDLESKQARTNRPANSQ